MLSFIQFINEKDNSSWVTVKSKDSDKGRHVLISNKDGSIISGLGDKFKGKKINDIYDKDFDEHALKGLDAHKAIEFSKPLNDKEKLALYSYSGNNYTRINKQLRGLEEKSSYVQEIIGRLDSVMKKSRTTEDMIAYRGISSSIFKSTEIGTEIIDEGFGSTTTKLSIAKRFAESSAYQQSKNNPDSSALIMEIRIPKGSRAVSMRKFTTYKTEDEILIDKKAKYKIVKSDKNKITVELIQE